MMSTRATTNSGTDWKNIEMTSTRESTQVYFFKADRMPSKMPTTAPIATAPSVIIAEVPSLGRISEITGSPVL